MDREKVLNILIDDADNVLKWANTIPGAQVKEAVLILVEFACDESERQYVRIMALYALRGLNPNGDSAAHHKFYSSRDAAIILTKLLDHATRMFVARNSKEILPGHEELLNCFVVGAWCMSYAIKEYRD